jgi:sugar (pentulose or hexulose) kinase
MSLTVGLDLGTSTLTAVAVEIPSGRVVGSITAPTPGLESPEAILACMHQSMNILSVIAGMPDVQSLPILALGVTGQQHGILALDPQQSRPITPFFGWQNQLGEQPHPQGGTWAEVARERVGDASLRTGCRLRSGYGVVTLFAQRNHWPPRSLVCTLMDFWVAQATATLPRTDPTCAASLGAWDGIHACWDAPTLQALELPASWFPDVVPAGTCAGYLTHAWAAASGLPPGLPVMVAIGDNQASFLGSVPNAADCTLVNVGTGGQVSATTEQFAVDEVLECRPYFQSRHLLVSAGQTGGAAFATLVAFFQRLQPELPWYEMLLQAAGDVAPGSDGVWCEPFFRGTRTEPQRRAQFSGLSDTTLTPGHLARALLEGIARTLAQGRDSVLAQRGSSTSRLIGAGNGLRANPLLARLVAESFNQPLHFPRHREEAAFGAALGAAVGIGLFADFDAAGQAVRCEVAD